MINVVAQVSTYIIHICNDERSTPLFVKFIILGQFQQRITL